MADYYNVTTNTGDAEIAAAIASNTKLDITHIAFGDGNGAVPTPLKTRTTLVREVHRQAVTKYERHPTNANWIVIETIIPSNIGGFWVREMGVIANGKMISHGSHAPFEKVADPTGVSEYRLKFTLNVKDGNVVNITLDQSLIYASQAWTDENYVPRDEIIDDLTTDDAFKPVSAKQAKNLQDNKLGRTENAVSASKLVAEDVRLLKPPLLPSAAISARFTVFDLLQTTPQAPFADTLTFNTYHDYSGGFKNALAFSKDAQAIKHYQAEYGATEWGIVKTLAYAEDVLAKSGGSLNGSLTIAPSLGNASLNFGRIDGVATTPFIDFNSSGNSNDYDTRIIASGGTGGNGEGTLTFLGARHVFSSTINPKIPPAHASISSLGDGGDAAIHFPNKLLDGLYTAFLPWLHGTTQTNAGYLQHCSFGQLRGSSDWDSGGFYMAVGGHDLYPTEAFYFQFGGRLAHSSGNLSLDGNAKTASKLEYARTFNGVAFDGSTNIDLPLLGVGQTWQDMTASRALNTTYTNSTGKPIEVSIYEDGIDGFIELHINGVVMAMGGNRAQGAANDQITVSAIIPNGTTYKLATKTQNYSYIRWFELR